MKRFSELSLGFLFVLLLVGVVFIAGCTTTQPSPATTTVVATPPTIVSGAEPKLSLQPPQVFTIPVSLTYLEPKFESQYNVNLPITSGTGKAIEIAKNGDADVLLVHSPSRNSHL